MMLQIIRDGMSHYVNVVQYRIPGPPRHIKDLIPDPRGGGGGGYSGFQVTGMIEWEQKSRPQKIPRASNKTPKNPWTKN